MLETTQVEIDMATLILIISLASQADNVKKWITILQSDWLGLKSSANQGILTRELRL